MNNQGLHSLLNRTLRLHRRRAGMLFNRYGLSIGQPRILEYLSNNDGCIQRQLAEHCHLEPASVTSVLTLMEKSGYIRRIASESDKRALTVWLTDQGWEATRQVDETFTQMEKECFAGFSDMEKQQAFDLLTRMYQNLWESNSTED